MKQKNVCLPFLWFTKLTGWLPAWLFFRPKVYYMDPAVQKRRLPRGSILMSNHKSLLDFVLYLIVFFGATVRFQMAEVLFNKGKFFASLLFGWGGIYVNRDSFNPDCLRATVEILEKGGKVGIFPQGRLPVGDKEWPFKPGILYVALQSGAPIIPIYTDGNYGFGKRAHVMIGTPIRLSELTQSNEPDREETARLLHMLEDKTNELKAALKERTSVGKN